jgi:hypothetical protein
MPLRVILLGISEFSPGLLLNFDTGTSGQRFFAYTYKFLHFGETGSQTIRTTPAAISVL